MDNISKFKIKHYFSIIILSISSAIICVLLFNGDGPSIIGIFLLILNVAAILHSYKFIKKAKEQKKQTENLVEIYRKLSLDFENAQRVAEIGSWSFDLLTQDLIWSRELYRIFEIDENCDKSVLYQKYLEQIHPDDRDTLLSKVDISVNSKIKQTIEHRLLLKNQKIKFVKGAWEPLTDSDGKVIKLIGICQDITLEVKKREEILAANARLSELIVQSPAVVFECFPNKNYTMWFLGDYIEEITGYKPMDFLGDKVLSYASIIYPEDRKAVDEAVVYSIKEKKPYDIKYRIIHRSGQLRWVWERGSLSDDNGNLRGIIIDITAEEAIHRKMEETQKVAKITSWQIDVRNQNMHLSKQLLDIFKDNLGSESINLENCLTIVHPLDHEKVRGILTKCLQDGLPAKFRFRSLLKNEDIIWFEAFCIGNYNTDCQLLSIGGTCQDITDLVRAEELASIEKSKSMHNSKLASLGAMTAGIAHEINNPLAVISSIIPFLRNNDVELSKRLEKLDAIERSVDKIKKITKSLNKYTRATSQREYSLHRIKDIIAESRDISSIKAKRSYVNIDLELNTDAFIFCDEVEIEQVLVNLMNNAIDAVTNLEDRWIKIRAFCGETTVIVQVINSGPLIPDDVAEKLFLPFFTTKPAGEGTGLGLSICKSILDQHNAYFFLNREMKNTCFEIHFVKDLAANSK